MSLPLDTTQAALLPVQLPEDPSPGQTVSARKEQSLGGASVIHVYYSGRLIGYLNRLIPVVNVSRKYTAERVTVSHPLKRNARLRIKAFHYGITEITFIEGFGWVGTKTTKPIRISDKFYRVLAAVPIGETEENVYLYEKLCLSVIDVKEGEH